MNEGLSYGDHFSTRDQPSLGTRAVAMATERYLYLSISIRSRRGLYTGWERQQSIDAERAEKFFFFFFLFFLFPRSQRSHIIAIPDGPSQERISKSFHDKSSNPRERASPGFLEYSARQDPSSLPTYPIYHVPTK